MGTWNVESLNQKEEELTEEIIKLRLDIIGITEPKKKDKGLRTLLGGYLIYWSRVDPDENARAGVAILIRTEKIRLKKIQ